jgi:pimeloyl-ACP methyl ester carboxylesterase
MRSNWKLRWLTFALTLYLLVCSVGGTYLADDTLRPPKRPLTEDDVKAFPKELESRHANLEEVSINTPDAVALRGWVLHPAQPNGNAALLLHGLGDNRLGMAGYAELLLTHGYTVLLPDARAHGASGGPLATYGLIERNDVHQWADFLARRMNTRCIYGIGESMGAAQLLQALQTGARFCAVVAESSFASFREIAYDRMGQPFHLGPWVGRTLLRPLLEIAFLRARWKYKLDMDTISPEDAAASSHIPLLLIHGQIDSNIPLRHSRLIHDRHPQAVLWEVPGADHCGAISAAPEEFETRVVAFFEHSPVLSAKATE